jgi:hypothetical protein
MGVACSLTPTPAEGAVIVDPSQRLGPIEPLIYGVNHGPWAFVSLDVQDAAVESGVRIIRFPGGNWGDLNTIRDYEMDQAVSLAREMQAELSVSVRLEGGSAEQAAELVTYANIENGYGIRYWSIGNEPLYYEGYDSERFNREWRAIAETMETVDPNILLIGPELTNDSNGDLSIDARDDNGVVWLDAFLEANGDLVDIVSIHYYPFPISLAVGNATPEQLLANPPEIEPLVQALRERVIAITGEDMPLAITEINSHWSNTSGGEATPDSFLNAIWWADMLGRLISLDIAMVNYFTLQSGGSVGGYGLLARREVRPTYYVYQLYRQFGEEQVDATSPDPLLSAYAALRADGALTVLLVNRDNRVKQLPLFVSEEGWSEQETIVLDREHMLGVPQRASFENNQLTSVPAHSVMLLILK